MSEFLIVAVLLTAAVVLALVYPLIRRSDAAKAAWSTAGIAVVLIGGGAALLYPTWSSWKWSQAAPAADSPAAMVGRLARRLEKQPDDLQGWLLLGRSYAVIQQYTLSARAYQRADTLAKGRSAEALMGMGDALINAGQSDFGARAGRLFEKALELEPNSVKALFFSAVAAAERNELPLARARYTRLLDGSPPPEVRRVIEEQIRAIDGMAALAAGNAAPGAARAPAAAQKMPAPAANVAVVTVPLRITVDAAVAGKARAGAPLFVLARTPGVRGPPLVAKRLDAKFPQNVELLSTDAVMGGSGFAAGQEIEIVARIANGGGAISQSGDPVGSVVIKAGSKSRIAVEINRLTP
jgi:cytochrome c-type biogenesis protein CcmH